MRSSVQLRLGRYRGLVVSPAAALLVALANLIIASPSAASGPAPGATLQIRRAPGPIELDGDLGDPGWQGADTVRTWFETRVTDNTEPLVRNIGLVTYDDHYFYVGFVFDDPDPAHIRAPLGDHDQISGNTDYAGVYLDCRNDGKTAQLFLSNARGLQYDAIASDVTGEDNSPDYFWDANGKITATGWTMEMRIPFSSLRYGSETVPTWGVILYRNYPRDRHYQFFSARMPRDVSCMVCNANKLTGLGSLPHGSHLTVTPFATSSVAGGPKPDLGDPFHYEKVKVESGLDLKWSPSAGMIVDGTLNPDFSQVEADDPQITANERFALSYPEKRPFFLEGVDLLTTSLRAIYTRTITDPSGGLRATGRVAGTSYTVLAAQDDGGGRVIIPGPLGSHRVPQDFKSEAIIGRVRRDFGQSFVSFLGTDREIHNGGGHNRVFGPDANWRPKPSESIKGQFLWSGTNTPDLEGRLPTGHAFQVDWTHSTRTFDWLLAGQDISPDFRAYNGFMPQVGYREAYLDFGRTFRPTKGFLSRLRLFSTNYTDFDYVDHGVITEQHTLGAGMDGRLNSFFQFLVFEEKFRVGDTELWRLRPRITAQASPGRVLNFVSLVTYFGQEIDFSGARRGTGLSVDGSISLRPNAHLQIDGLVSRRQVDLPRTGRLLTAQVGQLKTVWSINSNTFLRLILQYDETKQDTAAYGGGQPRSVDVTGSALFAYKLNWQTVFYLGYGEERERLERTDALEPAGRRWFSKLSYAWQM